MARFYIPQEINRSQINQGLINIFSRLDDSTSILLWRNVEDSLNYVVLRPEGIHLVRSLVCSSPIRKVELYADWTCQNGSIIPNQYRKVISDGNSLTAFLKEGMPAILSREDLVSTKGIEFREDLKVFPVIVWPGANLIDCERHAWVWICDSGEELRRYVTQPRRRWQRDKAQVSLRLNTNEMERLARLLNLSYVNLSVLSSSQENVIAGFREIPNNYEIAAVVTGKRFYGRKKEIGNLIEYVRSGKHVSVFGLQRVGKTSLVNEAMRQLKEIHDPSTIFVSMNLNSIPLKRQRFNDFVRDFLLTLLESLSQALAQNPKLASIEKEVNSYFGKMNRPVDIVRGLGKLFRRIIAEAGAKKLVVFLDELQVLGEADDTAGSQQPMFDQFIRAIGEIAKQSSLSFIFGGRYRVLEFNERYDWQLLKLCHPLELGFLDPTSAGELIQAPSRGYLDWDSQACKHLLSLTGGHPYFLQYLCSRIVRVMNAKRANRVVKDDVDFVIQEFVSSSTEQDKVRLLYADFERDQRVVARIFKGLPAGSWRTLGEIQGYVQQFSRKCKDQKIRKLCEHLALSQILEKRIGDPMNPMYRLNVGLLGIVFPADAEEGPKLAMPDLLDQIVMRQLQQGEENEKVEFKGSARIDLGRLFLGDGELVQNDKVLVEGFLSAAAGFFNSEGGCVVIGVLEKSKFGHVATKHPDWIEQKNIILIGIDHESVHYKDGWDGYQRMLSQHVENHLGVSAATDFTFRKENYNGKDLCIVRITPGHLWCYLDGDKFLVRINNQTKTLYGREMDDYKRKHLERS
jgi:hypothetical protein